MGKKAAAIVLILLMVFSTVCMAEKTEEQMYDNVISVNVWPYLGAFFNLGYERKIIDNLSVRVRGFYWGMNQAGWGLMGYGADIFFHPQNKALVGWFVGPRFDSWVASYSENGETANGALYFLGLQAGYRWVFEGGFEMGISLGGMKNFAASITSPDANFDVDPPFSGVILPSFDYELGWAF
ncbi:MAG: DUF3575 domain-containing protein [Candidatus Goldbacteria bacterium]|nr:DUF3575 domain-containing protein [Candidatus Goldiibacteriota bacterium]